MSVRASSEWLEQYKQDHPDRVDESASSPQSGASGTGSRPQGTQAHGTQAAHTPCTRAVHVHVPVLPPTTNELMRMHWSKRHKRTKGWKRAIKAKSPDSIHTPVHLDFELWTSGRRDVDALYTSAKMPIDGLVAAGVLPDDDPQCIASMSATQHTCSQGEGRVALHLETLDT